MKSFFKELFLYNYHSNQKIIKLFTNNLKDIPEKPLYLYNHILNAHEVWNSRISLEKPSFTVWETHPSHQLKMLDHANYLNSLLIINSADFDHVIKYTSSEGQPFESSIRDILFHIINHSTYHRGQIARELRISEIEPLTTDYIYYKREK